MLTTKHSISNGDESRTHRLQQGLQVVEFTITQLRLHLDFADNPLKPLESG